MTRFVDKNGKAIEISITNENGIDWTNDFFEIGGLEQNEDGEYIVDDVDYLIDYAESYANGTNGDAYYDYDEDGEVVLPNIEVYWEEV